MAEQTLVPHTRDVTQEIERKFLPSTVPSAIDGVAGDHLRQGYLAEDGELSVRLRITTERAMLTIKAGGGRSRTEVEVEVSDVQATALWPWTEGRRIDKTRHRVRLDDEHVAEIDLYHGDLDGLCTIEVEFDSDQAAERFEAPAWFGPEVTGRPEWTNAALSRNGRPS